MFINCSMICFIISMIILPSDLAVPAAEQYFIFRTVAPFEHGKQSSSYIYIYSIGPFSVLFIVCGTGRYVQFAAPLPRKGGMEFL